MSESTFITSLGRTGTRWLAECLGWPHDPGEPYPRMVSVRHLQLLATKKWKLPKDCEVIVITRDVNNQLVSILNRWRGLKNSLTNKDQWVETKLRQLATLSQLVSKGAKVIRYEEMTKDPEELDRLLHPHPTLFTRKRFNAYPKVLRFVPPWMKPLQEEMRKEYKRWLQKSQR